ncbi:methionyl-tRNA formyltransferase [Pedobacter psychrophilus]|uniref:Methionyl-tRNA formyltransferase n=1 Tax=Pedobacter psychrophilus TaxID=1826909 RepID=A0A179DME1_9SPHI|nr:methionyl-tRNA formyltransferase [Pedobacter psychrophilus]OAQ42227.1 methionyl-tRNA formyltransferase [Pedobacter psychrophilus]
MKIIFMGTPEFAVASLAALLNANFNIVGVVTAPDKPAGRGQKINESAVKKFAVENNLKVLQPEKLKNPEFIKELKSLNADLQVVVAFRMLPEIVWNMPKKGTINLHASLLPNYRGAAPINWAIINGEKESGVTTFFLKQEIDTGDILFSDKVTIDEEMTAGDLHDALMEKGAELLVKTVKAIDNNDYQEIPQESFYEENLKHAPKIFKDDCKINWNQDNEIIYNMIRGLSPFPTAFTQFLDKSLKVFKAVKEDVDPGISAGAYLSDGKTYLKFASKNGFISLKEIQQEGKKKMEIEDFLRGIRLD